jgi:hypothetical protein
VVASAKARWGEAEANQAKPAFADIRSKGEPRGFSGSFHLGCNLAGEDFSCRFQRELYPRIGWMSSMQVQVAKHATLCRSYLDEAGPSVSDEIGRSLDRCYPVPVVRPM